MIHVPRRPSQVHVFEISLSPSAIQNPTQQVTHPSINPNLTSQIQAEDKVHSFTNELLGTLTVLMIDNEPWFIAKQVIGMLGYPGSSNPVKRHCKHQRNISYNKLKDLLPGCAESAHLNLTVFRSGCIIISRSDVFALISGSRKPEAEVFRAWLNEHLKPGLHLYTLPHWYYTNTQLILF
jgi:prophage antirepressor-like protein